MSMYSNKKTRGEFFTNFTKSSATTLARRYAMCAAHTNVRITFCTEAFDSCGQRVTNMCSAYISSKDPNESDKEAIQRYWDKIKEYR